MPEPSIFGIGSRVQSAIERGKSLAVNVEREIRFSGRTLKIFEMKPSGEVEILSLAEDWKATRKRKSPNSPDKSFWNIEILASAVSYYQLNIGTTIKLSKPGADDILFSIIDKEEPDGNLGVWVLEAHMI